MDPTISPPRLVTPIDAPASPLASAVATFGLAAAAGELDAIALQLLPGVLAHVGTLRLCEGVTLADDVATVPAVDLVDVKVEAEVAALLRATQGVRAPDLALLDPLLDAVSGQANVDAQVGLLAGVPLPRVMNRLRLPIIDGTIDFTQLERGLHRLADAVLDFHVRDGRLELEKDIPFVPWDEATLVAWDLDARDQALAAQGRVRLRRLLDAQVLEERRQAAGAQGCFGLGSLGLEDIAIDVDLRPEVTVPIAGGAVQLGVEGLPGVSGLQLRGAVRCTSDGPAPASSVTLAIGAVNAAGHGLHALGFVAGAARVMAADVSGALSFEGLTPRRLTISAPKVRLEGLTIALRR